MKKIVLALMIMIISLFFIFADDIMHVVLIKPDGSITEIDDTVSFTKKSTTQDNLDTAYRLILDRRFYKSQEVNLQIDTRENIAGYTHDGEWHQMDDHSTARLLSDPLFDSYYPYRHTPELTAHMNGEGMEIDAQSMEWSVKLPDGNIRTMVEESSRVESWILTGNSVISFDFEMEPDSLLIQDASGRSLELMDGLFDVPDIESHQRYLMTAVWSQPDFSGAAHYAFDVMVDLPVEARIVGNQIRPGEFFTLIIANSLADGEPMVEQPFIADIEYFEKDGERISIIPVNYWFEPGTYSLLVDFPEAGNGLEIPIDIVDRKFDIQYLYIDEKIEETTRSDEAYEEYALYMNPARESSADEPLFSGKFIQPVEGRISTEFGMFRYVNDSLTSYRHSGIDIAIDRGTPIMATNNGRIVLARELILTGNTVVIDHGLGIFSVHFHMDSLNVEKGDLVEQGEIIGTVGSTGFSTGPHLHWTMSYYKTNLDPYQFMETELIP